MVNGGHFLLPFTDYLLHRDAFCEVYYSYMVEELAQKISVRRGQNIAARNAGLAILVFVTFIVGLFFIDVIKQNLGLEKRPVTFGATFSKPYAESMGLDWKKAYIAALDDLSLRRFRIPAYWDAIEPKSGVFDYADLDWQVAEAKKRHAKIIMAIGRKLPRWPECHVPAWTQGMKEAAVRARVITMLEDVVRRYKTSETIVAWQVENEPLFDFGICPHPDREFLKREVRVVRAADPTRRIIISESGELSTWVDAAGIADIIGISAYRSVWGKYIGYFYWPIGPRYYIDRAEAISALIDGIFISELQAEPWGTVPLISIDPERQRTLMNPQRLNDNVDFAEKIGFPEVYLWGIEWWYWDLQHGRPEMWEAGKRIIQQGKDVRGLF